MQSVSLRLNVGGKGAEGDSSVQLSSSHEEPKNFLESIRAERVEHKELLHAKLPKHRGVSAG